MCYIKADRRGYTRYNLPNVKIKDYKAMIDRRNFSDQSINNDIKIYENIRKIATGHEDDYTMGCLLSCIYF